MAGNETVVLKSIVGNSKLKNCIKGGLENDPPFFIVEFSSHLFLE
jgi:hypothetical protein